MNFPEKIMNYIIANQELVFWIVVVVFVGSIILNFFSNIADKLIKVIVTLTAVIIIGGCFGLSFDGVKDFINGNIQNENVQNSVESYFRFSQKVSEQMESFVTSKLDTVIIPTE